MLPSIRLLVIVLALGLAGAPGAQAEGAPVSEEEAADLALSAHTKGDAAALKAVVEPETPGAWLIAWRLCNRKEFAAALAVAKAVKGPDFVALPAYVEKCKSRTAEDPAVEPYFAALKLYTAEKHAEALALLPPSVTTTDPVLAARMGTTRGRLFLSLGRIPEVPAAYEDGARAAESVGWLARAGWLYIEAGFHAHGRGDMTTAERCFARHLVVAERLQDPKHLVIAWINNGSMLRESGQHETALAMNEKGIAAARALGDPVQIATVLDNQGRVCRDLGLLARAVELHEEAIQRALTAGEKALAAKAQVNLAWVHADLGEWTKSRELNEVALQNATDAGAGPEAADALQGMGRVDGELGLGERALVQFEQARKIYEQIDNALGQATALANMANVCLMLERPGDAQARLKQGLDMAARIDAVPLKNRMMMSLVGVHFQRRRFDEMRTQAEQGLAESERVADREGVVLFRTYVGLAETLLGRHEQAIATLREAQRAAQAWGTMQRESFTAETLAIAHLNAKQYADAMAQARTAIERFALTTRGLADEESAGARERRRGSPAVGATAAAHAGDVSQAVWFLESGRAGALLESLGGRKALAPGTLPPALLEEERKARVAEARAVAQRRAADGAKDAAAGKAAKAAADQARAALTKAVEAIQRQEKNAAAILYPKVRDVAALRALLGSADTLVLYGVFVEASVAVVIEPKGERVVLLGAPKAIDEAAELLRESAAQGRGAAELQAEADALAKLVVEPLKLSAGVKRVVISPDGPLVYTPWNLLLRDREVALTPSGTTWAELREPAKTTPGDSVLALGDPVYGQAKRSASGRTLFGEGDLAPLPATREEATKVGKVVLLGADATEARLRKALAERKRWRAVHFACHGLVDPERPARSALALTPDEEDDGFLSSLEVTRLRVPADLVVLSACETGRGKVIRGEGLMGLSRAFMLAGAPRVLASLWKVDDRATLLLMERFYAHWKPGTPASRALALAQRDVREHTTEVVDPEQSRAQGRDVSVKKQPYAAPAFWAGWVVWGLPD